MPDTLAALVRERADRQGDELAYSFLVDGERERLDLTYGQLADRAGAVAAHLARRVAQGGRVVLLFEPGPDFLVAFFACQLAAVAAVPVYPPSPAKPLAGLTNLDRVVADCRAELVLTSAACAGFAAAADGFAGLARTPWVSMPDAEAAGRNAPAPTVRVTPDALALLQYTSGSTGAPKGVMLRQEHLLANLDSMHWFVGRPATGTVVSWLPMYHDMGLIGTALYPVYRGIPGHLMSPLHFLHRPMRWLRLITRVGATISGGPSFAYQLCARRVAADDLAELDLGSWEVAFNGAEPINAEVVTAFEKTFAPAGLRPGTVVGCYGMAEAALLITGARRGDEPRILRVREDELQAGKAVACADDEPGRNLVSSGRLPPGHDVRIVDRDGGRELPDGQVGEIWFAGPSLSHGYWRKPTQTAAAFDARLDGTPAGGFLRTGDLGFLRDGQLFVTGRVKDLLVIRGRNVYPQDVEETAQNVDPRLRRGAGVAVTRPGRFGDGITLVQEVSTRDPEHLRRLAGAIRGAVLTEHQVPIDEIYLVVPRSVGKTSSGKLRRAATAAAVRAGEVAVLHHDVHPEQEETE
ncbi:fatty acyl-AMP ligase [Polymorphospora rubra]|uniref:fatty acyl-AMP ligase n=1 Tax=Polymorphospora rubra TaxID=338584 RepID=UPI0033FDBBFE